MGSPDPFGASIIDHPKINTENPTIQRAGLLNSNFFHLNSGDLVRPFAELDIQI
jgi:hypothetical protein